jgi:hypothetical protein
MHRPLSFKAARGLARQAGSFCIEAKTAKLIAANIRQTAGVGAPAKPPPPSFAYNTNSTNLKNS